MLQTDMRTMNPYLLREFARLSLPSAVLIATPGENLTNGPFIGPGLAKSIAVNKHPIDAALERNLQHIVPPHRRPGVTPSTATNPTAPLTANDLQLFDSAMSMQYAREMTPNSIVDDASATRPMATPMHSYGQYPWAGGVYPYPTQSPGLYLPYPTLVPPVSSLPTMYPSLIDQHYSSQGLSAYYPPSAGRLPVENIPLSGMICRSVVSSDTRISA
jgi:hypothetical protein